MPPYAGGGDPYSAGQVPPGQRRTSGLAIAALVLGILSIPGGILSVGLLGILLGILGIIFGIIGIRVGRRPGMSGRGLAIAGLVTGVVGLILGGVLLGFYGSKYKKCSDEHPGASRDVITQCVKDKISN
jgi:MFS family permease